MMFAFDQCYGGLVQWAWLTVGTHYKPRHTILNGLSQFKEDSWDSLYLSENLISLRLASVISRAGTVHCHTRQHILTCCSLSTVVCGLSYSSDFDNIMETLDVCDESGWFVSDEMRCINERNTNKPLKDEQK